MGLIAALPVSQRVCFGRWIYGLTSWAGSMSQLQVAVWW
jgi:hypothetical protein